MKIRTDLVPVNVASALEFLTMRMSHRRSSPFAGYLDRRYAKPQTTSPAEAPIETQYTPAQTMTLLVLRNSDLALAVLTKLDHSTARPSEAAKDELCRLYLAARKADWTLQLTVLGHFKANALAHALAEQLGVPIPVVTPAHQRGGFQRGVFSQAGNW